MCATDAITNPFRRLIAVVTDMMFTSSAQFVTSALASRGVRTYRYLFNQYATGTPLVGLGAFHSLDVPFVFDTLDKYMNAPLPQWNPSAALLALSKQMQSYWINF